MKMTPKKAKERLAYFQKKIDDGEWDSPIFTAISSLFKHVFGPDSDEYSFVKRSGPIDHAFVGYTDEKQSENHYNRIKEFLPHAIDLINDKGVYRPPTNNLLSSKTTWGILVIFLIIFMAGLIVGSFWPNLANAIKILWK